MVDNRQQVISKLTGYDFEIITITNTAIGLTASKLTTNPAPKEALIIIKSAQCNYRYDGGDPTSDTGFTLNPLDTLRIRGLGDLQNLKFIRTGGTSARAEVCYER